MNLLRTVVLHSCCVAGLAAAAAPALSGTAVFGTGYDHHTLIVPEILARDSGQSGASADARAQLDWQALRNSSGRVDVVANGGYRQVDDSALQELRAGGGVNGTGAVGAGAVTAAFDGERRWLDEAGLAWNAGLVLGFALPCANQVALPELAVRTWRFDDAPGDDGIVVAARYRHWLPLSDGDPRRRAELGVEFGRYQTDNEVTTCNEVRVDAGVRGRVGPNSGAGRWDFAAGGWYELRDYLADAHQRQHCGVVGSCDRWMDAAVAFGLETGWENIADQLVGDPLHQFQVSLRATAAF